MMSASKEKPLVSIIVPAYNQERYIREAIDSVLNQTYNNWELVIVDDGSVDRTASIVRSFADSRIKYFYQDNRGVSEARNSGIAHSAGELVAFLDADDLYHPEKIKLQVEYLNENQEIGLVAVYKILIDQDGNKLGFFSPSPEVGLSDILLSFPFAPSDLMVKREWIDKAGCFDHAYVINEDREWYVRLVLSGCKCAVLSKFLTYRRLNNQREFKNLPDRMNDQRRVLNIAFNDLRLPESAIGLCDQAFLNIYIGWAYQAFIQHDINLAYEYLAEAEKIMPAYFEGNAEKWLRMLIHSVTRDGGDYEKRLQYIFDHLPENLKHLQRNMGWAIARIHLYSGIVNLAWRREEGEDYLRRAREAAVVLDDELIGNINHFLLNFESAYGTKSLDEVMRTIEGKITQIYNYKIFQQIFNNLTFNQAFNAFHNLHYWRAADKAWQSIRQEPSYLFNRGLIKIFLLSVINAFKRDIINYAKRIHFCNE